MGPAVGITHMSKAVQRQLLLLLALERILPPPWGSPLHSMSHPAVCCVLWVCGFAGNFAQKLRARPLPAQGQHWQVRTGQYRSKWGRNLLKKKPHLLYFHYFSWYLFQVDLSTVPKGLGFFPSGKCRAAFSEVLSVLPEGFLLTLIALNVTLLPQAAGRWSELNGSH